MLARGRLAAGTAAAAATAGGTTSAGPEAARSRRAASKSRPLQPRLRAAAARTGDGWVGGGYRGHRRTRPPARPAVRLHPGERSAWLGVGTHATSRSHGQPAGESEDGVRTAWRWRYRQRCRHRQRWRRRPSPAPAAGPASRPEPIPSARRRARRLGGQTARHCARAAAPGPGADQVRPAPRGRKRRPEARLRLGACAQAAAVRSAARLRLDCRSPAVPSGPQLRMGARRSATTGGGSPAAVPRLQFKSAAPPAARRPTAAPKFGRRSSMFGAAARSGLVSGGVLDASTFRAIRRRNGIPRLRLASRGRATVMLGGSRGSALGRPVARVRKQPRFGYGKRSLLSFPAVRRIGGQWLVRRRAGSRSGAWLIGKRTGGAR